MAQGLTPEQVRETLDDVDGSPHISEPARGLLRLAEKATKHAYKVTQEDMDGLRGLGLTDEAILEGLHVIAFFNYMDRMADGLGNPAEGFQQMMAGG